MPDPSFTLSRAEQIPAVLRDIPRWCRWRYGQAPSGKVTKVPVGSTLDPRTQRPFETSIKMLGEDTGLGFIFTGGVHVPPHGWLYAFDIDACRDPLSGRLESWATEIIKAHRDSYTEVTPSGTGVRQFVFSRVKMDFARVKVRLPHAAAPNVPATKAVELQIFGNGGACYVTVSGDRLPTANERIAVLDNLNWLVEFFGLHTIDDIDASDALPRGEGEAPTLDAIERAVRAAPQGEALIAGRWEEVLGDSKGTASEVYNRLTQHVLRAAQDHGEVAFEFLMRRTAWGRGAIENSADPTRYARAEWVRRDIVRTARKMPAPPPSDVFEELPDLPVTPAVSTSSRLEGEAEFYTRFRSQEFLVYGALPRVGLAQFFGDPSAGKTPLAISLAIAVASGQKTWFGHDVDRHGAVVYFVGEDPNGVSLRFQAEKQKQGLTDTPLPIAWTKQPGRLSDPKDVAAWIKDVRAFFPDGVALVVVDTQSNNFGGGNENDTEDMTKFRDCCEVMKRLLGCLVLTVHHTGHKDKERGRGSSVFFGSLDACFEVTKMEKAVQAVARKYRNWQEPEPLSGLLEVHVFAERTDAKGRPVTAITLRDTPAEPGEVFAADPDVNDSMIRLLRAVHDLGETPTSNDRLGLMVGVSGGGRKLRNLLDRATGDLKLVTTARSGRGRAKVVYRLTEKGRLLLAGGEAWEP